MFKSHLPSLASSTNSSRLDHSELLEQLETATPFELYRLKAALDRMLDDPARIAAVKSMIRVGDEIEYFEPSENRCVKARVLRCNRTRAVVKNIADGVTWQILYESINVHGDDVAIHARQKRGLDRNEVRVGDNVGFLDSENREIFGTVVRLNPKTVTLRCEDGQQWRVAYGLLHRVLAGEWATKQENVELLSYRSNDRPR